MEQKFFIRRERVAHGDRLTGSGGCVLDAEVGGVGVVIGWEAYPATTTLLCFTSLASYSETCRVREIQEEDGRKGGRKQWSNGARAREKRKRKEKRKKRKREEGSNYETHSIILASRIERPSASQDTARQLQPWNKKCPVMVQPWSVLQLSWCCRGRSAERVAKRKILREVQKRDAER